MQREGLSLAALQASLRGRRRGNCHPGELGAALRRLGFARRRNMARRRGRLPGAVVSRLKNQPRTTYGRRQVAHQSAATKPCLLARLVCAARRQRDSQPRAARTRYIPDAGYARVRRKSFIAVSESPRQKTIAVILTALEVETRAVLRQLGSFTNETVSGTGFFKGQFEGRGVAVAEVGPGNVSASAIAARALGHYEPDVAMFVGVAGGVKDVAIGDVVVGTKVYGYEFGKEAAGGFKTRPDVMNTAHDLEQRARSLRQRQDWKNCLDPEVNHEGSAVFVGPIAAGEKVVAARHSATAHLIRDHYGDALAVEMEGRGFLEAVHISHPVRGCVVRGISDLLSGKANADEVGSQQRAADAASAVAFEILSGLGGGAIATTPAVKFIEKPSTFSPSAGPQVPLRQCGRDGGFHILRIGFPGYEPPAYDTGGYRLFWPNIIFLVARNT